MIVAMIIVFADFSSTSAKLFVLKMLWLVQLFSED